MLYTTYHRATTTTPLVLPPYSLSLSLSRGLDMSGDVVGERGNLRDYKLFGVSVSSISMI